MRRAFENVTLEQYLREFLIGPWVQVLVQASLRDDQTIFVCGSAPFTNAVGDLLVDLGVAPERAKFERFGPSASP